MTRHHVGPTMDGILTMSVCEASNQAMWYRTYLGELGYEVSSPVPLHCDNKGAVDLSENPITGRL